MKAIEIPIEMFVCPITKRKLRIKNDTQLISPEGLIFHKDLSYHFWNFIPEGIPELFTDKWLTWNELQNNATESYVNDPEHNLSVGKREDCIKFSEFCSFSGMVLDVGSGPQRCAAYMEYCQSGDVNFFGIDPLVGEQPKCYGYVQGLAEYLPFRDELFNQVLFATSLDHFVDPLISLREAKKVLVKSGSICIWIGEKNRDTPLSANSPEWYRKLQTPVGADDPFHFKRLSSTGIEALLNEADLSIVDKCVFDVDEFRKTIYYRVKKV